jgi:hypothetical protein
MNRAHDESPCVDTSITPHGPSGDGVIEGLLVIDTVGLRDAVDVDVEVAVRVQVALEVTEPVAVAVIDTEAVKEGVVVRVGVTDGVTEDVMEMVGDGEALATVSSYSEVPVLLVAMKYTCSTCTHIPTRAHMKMDSAEAQVRQKHEREEAHTGLASSDLPSIQQLVNLLKIEQNSTHLLAHLREPCRRAASASCVQLIDKT